MIELNEEQFGILQFFMQFPLPLYVVAHPIKTDKLPMREAFKSNLANIKSLVKVGLISDITKKNLKLVKEAQKKGKRPYSVFTLPNTTRMMFSKEEALVN